MNTEGYNQLSNEIISCCIEVHKQLGPGLLESVYEICLAKEFDENDIEYKRQVHLPIVYKKEKIDAHFRLDSW